MSDIETRQKKLPVLLFIRGEQYFDDVDPDATELTTEGTLELAEKGLLERASMVANCGMEGEAVYPRFAELIDGSGYFSVVLVKKGEEA